MKRTTLLVGIGALLVALIVVQPAISQMGTPPSAAPTVQTQSQTPNQQMANPMDQTQNPAQLQLEIQLLRAIDMAGLSKAQLTQLQGIVMNIKNARDAVPQAQQQLRDFLLSFQGTPADFEKAVAPYDQKVQAAQKTLQDALTSGVVQVKGMLTISQGEALLMGLRPLWRQTMGMSPNDGMRQQMQEQMQSMQQGMAGMQGMMGMMSQRTMGPMQQMMDQMKQLMQAPYAPERMGWSQALLDHLDLIDQVLAEKLGGMKS